MFLAVFLLMQLLDLLEHKSIFTAGYKAILHIHSLVEECEITSLISALDMKTKPPTPKKVSGLYIDSKHDTQPWHGTLLLCFLL